MRRQRRWFYVPGCRRQTPNSNSWPGRHGWCELDEGHDGWHRYMRWMWDDSPEVDR